MKNINKNLIKKFTLVLGIALITLAILAVGSMLMPTKAHAYTAGYVSGYNTQNFNSENEYNSYHAYSSPAPIPVYQPIYQTQPVVYQTQPRVEYVNQPQANTSNTDASTGDPKVTSVGVTTADYKDLTANSLFGRFSFMPSGLMQWILLAIFILVIVILIRKVTGGEDRYHSTPLKHA